jgi:hypothetical protein
MLDHIIASHTKPVHDWPALEKSLMSAAFAAAAAVAAVFMRFWKKGGPQKLLGVVVVLILAVTSPIGLAFSLLFLGKTTAVQEITDEANFGLSPDALFGNAIDYFADKKIWWWVVVACGWQQSFCAELVHSTAAYGSTSSLEEEFGESRAAAVVATCRRWRYCCRTANVRLPHTYTSLATLSNNLGLGSEQSHVYVLVGLEKRGTLHDECVRTSLYSYSMAGPSFIHGRRVKFKGGTSNIRGAGRGSNFLFI